jgi:hypothetical protein
MRSLILAVLCALSLQAALASAAAPLQARSPRSARSTDPATRTVLAVTPLFALSSILAQSPVVAQSQVAVSSPVMAQARPLLSLPQLKLQLADEGRDLSGLTYRELASLEQSAGGTLANLWNPEFVFRIGESTFIINMRLISIVLFISISVVVLLFSPLGFMFFRGGAHAFIGAVLQSFRIAPEFGEHLRLDSKKWLQRETTARRAFRSYMRHAFIPEYRNNVTAVAFLGTAFLILAIGLRGIKFMVAHQPDMIIMAIIVEISVLCMLGLTTWYERADETAPAETDNLLRLPQGQYLDKNVVMAQLQRLSDELTAAAAEKGGK